MRISSPWIQKFLQDRNGILSIVILFGIIFCAAFAPLIAPYPADFTATIHPTERLKPPSMTHFFGTDHMGRDIFSRVMFGARTSLIVTMIAIGLALILGTVAGLFAGYYEGFVGQAVMRTADIFLSIPQIVMALVIVAALGPGINNTILALSITYWPFWSRVVYADIVTLKKSAFLEAAHAIGARTGRIIFLHMLPNIAPNIIVRTTIGMGGTILTMAVLSFVGLGAQPPIPDWGLDLATSRGYLPTAWWYSLFPGLAILVTVMAFNMFGDTLRDVLDPRLRISFKGLRSTAITNDKHRAEVNENKFRVEPGARA